MENSNLEKHIKAAENLVKEALKKAAISIEFNQLDIEHLPHNISQLGETLTHLKIANCNDLKNLYNIEKLKNLRSIDLFNCNSIEDLYPIDQLILLEHLNIVRCLGLAHIAPISKCVNLHTLKFFGIKTPPNFSTLKFLKNLRYIELDTIDSLSGVSQLPELSALQRLHINFCESLTSLENIERFKNLKELKILSCKNLPLTEIKRLSNLPNFITLELFSMDIEDIEFAREIPKLERLHLKQNSISNLEPIKGLNKLISLDLSLNSIHNLEDTSFLLSKHDLRFLQLDGNPFLKKLDIDLKERENALPLLKNHVFKEQGGTVIEMTLPVKVLFLGNHACGKSTLAKQLTNGTLANKTESTHILDIKDYVFNHKEEDSTLRLPDALIYDFGGQDYYHGIYRIFMNVGTITCLLWHPKSNENKIREDANDELCHHFSRDYWLGYWRHYHRDKLTPNVHRSDSNDIQQEHIYNKSDEVPDSRILMVQTRADEHSKANPVFSELIENQHLLNLNKDKQDELSGCAIQYFQSQLNKLIDGNRKVIRAADWYQKFLKHIFEQHKKDDDKQAEYCDVDTLVELYNPDHSSLDERKENLVTELKQLSAKGIVLYYPQINMEAVWLNPKGFTRYVHDTLLSKNRLVSKKGIISVNELDHENQDIIKILEQEKVIFRHQYGVNGEEYIIPNYLPLCETHKADYRFITFGLEKDLLFSLWFKDYLPIGLINQLICFFGTLPHQKIFWRDQLIFTLEPEVAEADISSKNKTSLVQIQLEFKKHLKIKVYLKNDCTKTKKSHCEYIYYVIMCLYHDLQPEKELAAFKNVLNNYRHETDCDTENASQQHDKAVDKLYKTPAEDLFISLDDQHFISAKVLANSSSETQITCELCNGYEGSESHKTFATKVIPIGDFSPFTHNKLRKQVNVFISYCHQDIAERHELQKFLTNLERDGIINIWQDGLLKPGEDWHQSIVTALEKADVVIMLVSQNFITSSYVNSVELPIAIQNFRNAKAEIFPILLKHCDYKQWNILPNETTESTTPEDRQENSVNISQYQFLPMDDQQQLKPINQWQYPEKAWTQIVEKLRDLS